MTDSKFLLNAVHLWMDSWRQRNWNRSNGQRLKNWIDFESLDCSLKKFPILVDFYNAHADHNFEGIIEATKLAQNGALKYQQNNLI